jgi:hypothetical protein
MSATIKFDTFASASYLRIQNAGVSDIDMLTVVGATSARDNMDKVGQFGSGFKYFCALCMRENVDIKVFCGKNGYEFGIDCKDVNVNITRKANKKRSSSSSNDPVSIGSYSDSDNDIDYDYDNKVTLEKIYMKQFAGPDGRRRIPMMIDTRFGAIDWTSVTMGVREMISNAMDSSIEHIGTYDEVTIEGVDEVSVRAKDGYTRVYIQMTQEIREYLYHLYDYFPALRNDFNRNASVIDKPEPSKLKVYRKGVLVGEFNNMSLFDYNLNDIPLKESRVVDFSSMGYYCSKALATAPKSQLNKYLRNDNEKIFEVSHLGSWNLKAGSDETRNHTWKNAIQDAYGREPVLCDSTNLDNVRSKGLNGVIIDDATKLEVIKSYGFKTASDVLSDHELKGRQIVDVTPNVEHIGNFVWGAIVEMGATDGKDKPQIKCFHDVMKSAGERQGFWDKQNNFVGISMDIEDSTFKLIQTFIEEYGHYVTGAADFTRDIQDYGFRIAARYMEKELNKKKK